MNGFVLKVQATMNSTNVWYFAEDGKMPSYTKDISKATVYDNKADMDRVQHLVLSLNEPLVGNSPTTPGGGMWQLSWLVHQKS